MPFFDHYPYTNLHNVNLDWVLEAVKNWGAMVEQNNQNFIDLNAANDAFKEYINEHIAEYEEYITGYITNLDVQEEINNKLDQMLASGALTQYFSPYIKTDVENWLAENITPTTPPVDASLSIPGAAADAKAVGDRLESIDISIDTIYEKRSDISYTVSANYALTGDGRFTNDSNSELHKYTVSEGEIIYLHLSDDNSGVYQFQSSSVVPSSLPSAVIIGEPVTVEVDAFVKVPVGATYLITSQLKTNNTNVVKYASCSFLKNNEDVLLPSGVVTGFFNENSETIGKVTTDDCRILYYRGSAGSYTITRSVLTNVFRAAITDEFPVQGTTIHSVVSSSSNVLRINATTECYILVYCYYNENADFNDIMDSIVVKADQITTDLSNNVYALNLDTDILELFTGESVGEIITTNGEITARIISDAGVNIAAGLSTCIPIFNWKKIYFVAQSTHSVYYAFLVHTISDGLPIQYSSKVSGRKTVSANTSALIDVPDDAVYLYIQISTGDRKTALTPEIAYFYSKNETDVETVGNNASEGITDIYNSFGFISDSNGRDIPPTLGVLNAYKKAKQLNLLNWNALYAIPTNDSATGCPAGAHTGMLYSEALQFEKYVPYGCSIKSFMTAIHNPHSVMYTEDTKATPGREKTKYGFDYLNTTLNGAFYGTVCCTFTSWCLGMKWGAQTYDMEWMANDGDFIIIKDNSATGLRLGDILYVPGHTQIVTDIYRDDRGLPTRIFISESVQNYVSTLERTADFINNYLQNGKIYRYRRLYENLEYTPSEFVAIDDETITPYTYNNDICTYLGDCVSIADWEHMFINYTKGLYTGIELYKDDILLDTISLPSQYNDTHSVDITENLSGGGLYKARLTDGTNHSDYTYFEVVESTVTRSFASNGNMTVNFTSTRDAVCIKIKEANGHVLSTYVLSAQEIAAGMCTYNPDDLRVKQGREAATNTQYVRVFFKGLYNQVMSDYVEL